MSSNVGLKGLRGTLETALESSDLLPLLKLVCQNPRRSIDSSGGAGADLLAPSSAGRVKDDHLIISEGTLSAVVHSLQSIAERRTLETQRTCQAHAVDITTATKDLAAVQHRSAELRRRSQGVATRLQRQGGEFDSRAKDIDQALLLRDRVAATRAALAVGIDLLSQCNRAAEGIHEGRLLHVRRLLTSITARHEDELRAGATGGGAHSPGDVLAPASQLGVLSAKIIAQLEALEGALERRLAAELNDWLTAARAVAGAVGQRAMEAEEEQSWRRAKLRARRREIAGCLASAPEGQESAAAVRTAATVLREETAAAAATEAQNSSSAAAFPLAVLEMSPLLRCVQVHAADSALPRLLESYASARQAQLGADLAPPGDLLKFHRPFLHQIVGFFAIERRVAALAPELGTAAHAEALWQGAAAALTAELGAAIDEANRSEDVCLLKDCALLACRAVDRYCGGALPTQSIREALLARGERHRTILSLAAAAKLESCYGTAAGVASAVADVAEMCREYLQGLVEPLELPAAVVAECDKVLATAVAAAAVGGPSTSHLVKPDSALAGASKGYSNGKNSGGKGGDIDNDSAAAEEFSRLLRQVATAAAAQQALAPGSSLIGLVQGSPVAAAADTQLNGAVFALEESAGRAIASGAERAVEALAGSDWCPAAMPRTGGVASAQLEGILEVLRAGKAAVEASGSPLASQQRVMTAALRWVGDVVMQIFASPTVKALNAFGAQRLLSDLEALCRFGEDCCGGKAAAVAALAEPISFFEAVAFGEVGGLLGRGGKYAVVSPGRAAAILEKVQSPEVLLEKAGGAATAAKLTSKEEAARVAAALRAAEDFES